VPDSRMKGCIVPVSLEHDVAIVMHRKKNIRELDCQRHNNVFRSTYITKSSILGS
jgi:hypothetical protein